MIFPEYPKGSGHEWNEDHIDIGTGVQVQVPVLSCEDCDTWLYWGSPSWRLLYSERSETGLVFIKNNEVNICSKIKSMRLMEATIG